MEDKRNPNATGHTQFFCAIIAGLCICVLVTFQIFIYTNTDNLSILKAFIELFKSIFPNIIATLLSVVIIYFFLYRRGITLGLDTSTHEVLSNKTMSEMNKDIKNILNQLTGTLQFLQVRTFSSHDEAIMYCTMKTRTAARSIYQASMDNIGTQESRSIRDGYVKSREESICENKVTYKYIASLLDKDRNRLDMGKKHLENTNFSSAYYINKKNEFPLLHFIIFDEDEVFTRDLYITGNTSKYISIKNTYVVAIFSQYFNRLWDNSDAIKLENDDVYIDILKSLA